jgi:hypothetical protein
MPFVSSSHLSNKCSIINVEKMTLQKNCELTPLVKECSVWAEERGLAEAAPSAIDAHLERLAVGLDVCVVPTLDPPIARKRSLGCRVEDGVVLPGRAGHGHPEHVNGGHARRGQGIKLAVAGQEVVLKVVDF